MDFGRSLTRGAVAALIGACMLASPGTVHGETINDAMEAAYSGNPNLRAERARQRATDEQVPQELSGWRPRVNATLDIGIQKIDVDPGPDDTRFPADMSITLAQPVFRGFKTVRGVKRAEASVEAGRQNLLAVEQQILFDAATAYMNVIRDRRILALRERNVVVLREQLRAAQERFNVGEVTRTDVAQARARLSLAESTVASARSNLASSIANYVNVVGHAPGSLKYPKLPKLPGTLDSAKALAEKINPNILAAAFVAEAARHNVEVVKGDLLPEVSIAATALKTVPDIGHRGNTDTFQIVGSIDIPLYEGGAVYSAVREAKQTESQRRIEIISASRDVRELVVSSWNFLIAARETITAAKSQVSANQLALEGVRQEYLVGSRTTLDVLDAEAELVESQVQLVSAERDQVIAAYQLLASVGQLTARKLSLRVPYYDPIENYGDVRNKWIGTDAHTVD